MRQGFISRSSACGAPAALLLALLAIGVCAQAQPATQPIAPEIAALIDDLADPDPVVRESATQRLRDLGEAAMPALEQATGSDTPEIRARAAQIIQQLQSIPGGPLDPMPNFRNLRVNVRNGQKSIDVVDGRHTIHLEQDEEGIRLTITAEENGRTVTRTYEADTPEELERMNRDAYAVFERWNGGDGPGWRLNGPQIIVRGGAIQIGPGGVQVVDAPDPLLDLADALRDQMRKQEVPAADRQQIELHLARLREMNARLAIDVRDREKQMAEFLKESDALREKLAAAKLPDPGSTLPPPASERLGVAVQALGNGLSVTLVMPDSRADKLGIRSGDVITRVDDRAVRDVETLRTILREARAPVVVEVMRDRRSLKLAEPADPATRPAQAD